jgi:hypothetical protein
MRTCRGRKEESSSFLKKEPKMAILSLAALKGRGCGRRPSILLEWRQPQHNHFCFFFSKKKTLLPSYG